MDIKIPEKYREEFDRFADFAVNIQKFTVRELAQELGTGELAASIMVGYMEKTGLVTKGKLDDVRSAKISAEEWEKIGKKIENYKPLPEIQPKSFHAEAKQITQTLEDIIPENAVFYKTQLFAKDSFIILKSKEEVRICIDDIAAIFVIKPNFFKKGAMVFSAESELDSKKLTARADTLLFRKKDYEKIKKIGCDISERLGIPLKQPQKNTV